MKLSLGQAAKLAGRGKTTLTRAIKAGRLSAERAEGGGYRIDVSELARVYELRHHATPETVSRDRHAVHHATPHATVTRDPRETEAAVRLAELETEVRLLREMLAEVRESRDELRAERDDWRSRAERLLTDQRTPAARRKPAPTPETPETVTATSKRMQEILERLKAERAAS